MKTAVRRGVGCFAESLSELTRQMAPFSLIRTDPKARQRELPRRVLQARVRTQASMAGYFPQIRSSVEWPYWTVLLVWPAMVYLAPCLGLLDVHTMCHGTECNLTGRRCGQPQRVINEGGLRTPGHLRQVAGTDAASSLHHQKGMYACSRANTGTMTGKPFASTHPAWSRAASV